MSSSKEFFIGRKRELSLLDSLYNSDTFEMLIMHGRRRVGKSYLLAHFAKLHSENTIFFTGDKSSEKTNVQKFCEELKRVLKVSDFIDSFEKWSDIYSFFKDKELKERLVIIIDEFTYLYNSNPAYDSGLQNAIDRILKNKNIFLILCGSEVSVIEEIIDNSSKPLYGRKTAELKLLPFDYIEARDFFPNYSKEDYIKAYSILGGIPLYLKLFDDRLSVKENVIKNCLSQTGVLFNEIETLLRMELKETYFYKNIMLAINAGASTFNTIKERVDENSAKVAKYMNVLCNLGFIKKEVPCGEKSNSRNTLYSICDNYFAFYFMFIFKKQNMLNGLISPELYFEREMNDERLNVFIGHRFESICETYLKKLFYNGKMPFFAENLGRWWGNNPVLKKQEEIEKMQLNFLQQKYEEKNKSQLFAAASDLVKLNGAFSRVAKEGKESIVETSYNPDDILTPYSSDLAKFFEAVAMEPCKVKVFAGLDLGVDPNWSIEDWNKFKN